MFLKNGILGVGEIENVDVKKFGNGNVDFGEDEVFKKNKYKENLLRKRKKYRLNFMLRKIKRFFYVRKKENALMHFLEYRKMIRKKMGW